MNFTSLHAETDPAKRAHLMNQMMPIGLDTKMEIEFLSISAELCIGKMPVAGNNQPFGILHGGANAVFAESLASIAALMLISEGQRAVGLQVQMTHHGAAKSGFVTGEAKVVHAGKSIATYNVEIKDDTGKLTSSGQVICFLKR
jgi:1,4-dihydroxy-2-naphthoyl-CoA hydrolase